MIRILSIAGLLAAVAAPALAQSAPILVSSPGGGDRELAGQAATAPPPAPGSGQLWTKTNAISGANGVTGQMTIVANPPIPDTLENRARYGGPMSHHRLRKPEPPVGQAPVSPAPGR